jgi:hypothetical protein
MSKKTPYCENFKCSILNKVVQITGTTVTLYDDQTPVASEVTNMSCSGMSSCGVLLGSSTCPFKKGVHSL